MMMDSKRCPLVPQRPFGTARLFCPSFTSLSSGYNIRHQPAEVEEDGSHKPQLFFFRFRISIDFLTLLCYNETYHPALLFFEYAALKRKKERSLAARHKLKGSDEKMEWLCRHHRPIDPTLENGCCCYSSTSSTMACFCC